MKKCISVLLLVLILAGCAASPAGTPKEPSDTGTNLTDNAFLDAKVESKLSQGGGVLKFVTVSKADAQSASAEDYAAFLDERVRPSFSEAYVLYFDDGTGVIYYGCDPSNAVYGSMNSSGSLLEGKGYLFPNEDGTYIFVEYSD